MVSSTAITHPQPKDPNLPFDHDAINPNSTLGQVRGFTPVAYQQFGPNLYLYKLIGADGQPAPFMYFVVKGGIPGKEANIDIEGNADTEQGGFITFLQGSKEDNNIYGQILAGKYDAGKFPLMLDAGFMDVEGVSVTAGLGTRVLWNFAFDWDTVQSVIRDSKNDMVLSSTELGPNVTLSSLKRLGVLDQLDVEGQVYFQALDYGDTPYILYYDLNTAKVTWAYSPSPDLTPLTLDPNLGRVGVNNISPQYDLDVDGSARITNGMEVQNGIQTSSLDIVANNPGEGLTVSGDIKFPGLFENTTADGILTYDSTSGDVDYIPRSSFTPDLLPITLDKANSRVGINNASPQYALDVNGGGINIPNINAYRIATKNGLSLQGSDWSTVAVGPVDTVPSTSTNGVAIGNLANAGTTSVSIGHQSGRYGQGANSIAIGSNAGTGSTTTGTSQGTQCIAIGNNAGTQSQGSQSIALGVQAGQSFQNTACVAIGANAGRYSQAAYGIAIGINAGQGSTTAGTNQATNAVAIGNNAGSSTQGTSAVSLGIWAGRYFQGASAVAIGNSAGMGTTTTGTGQGVNAVAIGLEAGSNTQGRTAIGIGQYAGRTSQGESAIAIGTLAGQTGQATNSIAIGASAGNASQESNSIAIGNRAGQISQGILSVSLGYYAAYTTQGANSVAIGNSAGRFTQGINAVSVGSNAGAGTTTAGTSQGSHAVAIGYYAGNSTQGENAIAIGREAGLLGQHANSIILNSSGTSLNSDGASRFYVKPIRNLVDPALTNLSYNPTSGEITYGNTGGGAFDPAPITLDKANNRVGINQTVPTKALDITGDVRITGTIDCAGIPPIRFSADKRWVAIGETPEDGVHLKVGVLKADTFDADIWQFNPNCFYGTGSDSPEGLTPAGIGSVWHRDNPTNPNEVMYVKTVNDVGGNNALGWMPILLQPTPFIPTQISYSSDLTSITNFATLKTVTITQNGWYDININMIVTGGAGPVKAFIMSTISGDTKEQLRCLAYNDSNVNNAPVCNGSVILKLSANDIIKWSAETVASTYSVALLSKMRITQIA